MKELYIDKENNIKKVYLIENNIIIERNSEDIDNPMIEGNIYVGKVQNVLPGMRAAFVKIGNYKNAFIHLRDLLPKKDVTKEPDDNSEDIRNLVKPGDSILVQVIRDENYKKGAKLTTHISFIGRFFVYMLNTPFIAMSQKIGKNEKEELKEFFRKNLPSNVGGIVRTSANNAFKEDRQVIIDEIKRLNKKWEQIQNTDVKEIPQMLYNAGGIVKKYIVDNSDKNLNKIYVKNKELKEEILSYLDEENIKIDVKISENYLDKFDYKNQLKKSEKRKIWLECGGFITIDKTEALTAIDVNSGKFIGKDDFEKTIFKVNKEATIEIAKQIRLRDIGGIIIIDYIDMNEENKKEILKIMEQETKKDNSKVQIEGFTKLDLLELTRKHMYTN